VCPQPKAYPWLLDARQVHIAVLLVVVVEDIAQEFLEQIITADFGNGAGSLKIGRCGMPWLTLETASEGTVDIIESLESPIIQSSPIIVSVESLLGLTLNLDVEPLSGEIVDLLIVVLIQVVIESALDIMLRLLHPPFFFMDAEILYGRGGRPVVPGRNCIVSRTSPTSPVVEDKEPIHVVLIVMSPDRGFSTESPWLDLYIRSRLNVEVVVVGHSQSPGRIPGKVRRAVCGCCCCCVSREGIPASCAYQWDWMITCCHSTSSAYVAKDIAYEILPETHPPTV